MAWAPRADDCLMLPPERIERLRHWYACQLGPFLRWYVLPAALLIGAVVATAGNT